MKKSILILTLLISFTASAQVGLGFYLGGTRNAAIGSFSISLDTKVVSGDLTVASLMRSSEPAYFTFQLYKKVPITENWSIAPMAGYSYKMQSADIKSANYSTAIAGVQVMNQFCDCGSWLFRYSRVDNRNIFLAGLRVNFIPKD